jgi:type VI secretion system secreted protein VgrG
MSRRVEITTPFGTQVQFRQMIGTEALSSLHGWEIDLVSDSKSLDYKQALGKHATLTVETQGQGKRYLDGIVTRFGMHGQDTGAKLAYRMILSPWLWLATRKSDFKIWQNMTVPQIIESVLAPFGKPMEFKLSRAYRQRDYTVQYHESCHNFVARLCESEGIYWRYVHQAGSHTVVFCDDVVSSHEPLPGGDQIPFHPPGKAALADKEHIYAWQSGQEVRPGKAYLDDYDFKKPRADLSNALSDPPGHSHDQWESYVWPGGYTQHADGETYTRMQLQTDLAGQQRAQAQLTLRSIAPGYTFKLTNYPREDQNRQYLVVAVSYHLQENVQFSQGEGGAADGGSIQQFAMEAHPTSIAYRPEIVTPKPRTQGPQTAVVVGPPGEEIWTDQYGRVKVQFHWDRIGAMDENSSCWVRVSTSWAGPNFGAVHIPRIGMEVIVDFLNGDPDYPIILGCVYNAVNMPPWSLPGNATQSGILTRSSKGGAGGAGMGAGGGDANALRFEDKAGSEQLWLHAQKDQLTEVENDEKKWVGRDRVKDVDRDETNHIGRDRTETVDHDETITVHNNRTERVDHNEKISIGDNRTEDVGLNETISIGKNRTETVGDNETISIGKNRTETVGKNESVSVGNNQTFSVGDNRTKSVGKNESDSIGKNWSISVAKMKTETIGIGAMQNIGIFKMVNIGAAYNLNVGAVMMTNTGLMRMDSVGMNWSQNTGATHSVTAGATFSVTVGAASLVMTADGTITLKGTKVIIDGGQHVDVSAARIDLN